MRVVSTSVVLGVCAWLYQAWTLLIVAAVFTAMIVIHGININRLPTKVSRRDGFAVQTTAFMTGLSWNAGVIHVWMLPDTSARLLGLAAVYLSMMNGLMSRREDPLLIQVDIVVVIFSAIALPVISLFYWDDPQEALQLTAMMVAGVGFFLYGLRDVQRSQRELRAAQARDAERERMAALGRLTGGVAHDFNNLLTVIGGNMDLIREVSDPEQKDELARQAAFATQQASKITDQLLTFVGRGMLQPRETDLSDCIENLAKQVRRGLPSNVKLRVVADMVLPVVKIDPEHFVDVLGNLCVNARDAMPDGGVIQISCSVHRAPASRLAETLSGRSVAIEVSDSGSGIGPDDLPRVWEPYYSTHKSGGGMGLAMAKGFAMQSGGEVTITSQVGKGTIVTLLLPVMEDDA